jgi:hypothetical protein
MRRRAYLARQRKAGKSYRGGHALPQVTLAGRRAACRGDPPTHLADGGVFTSESERAAFEAQMLYRVHVVAGRRPIPDLAILPSRDAYARAKELGDGSLEFLAARHGDGVRRRARYCRSEGFARAAGPSLLIHDHDTQFTRFLRRGVRGRENDVRLVPPPRRPSTFSPRPEAGTLSL